ncbi:MAG TPA: molecular chaperone DnaK, partial [Solirubrobacteraceae bacterium]|nr:molecular chaperone DnaK [Solirubrobacteraceae bacterium]
RETLESDDAETINAKSQELQNAFHAVSEAMYQRAQEQAAGAGSNGAASGGQEGGSDEDVVDAEVVDEPKV